MAKLCLQHATCCLLATLACIASGCREAELRHIAGVPFLYVSGCDAYSLGFTIGKTFGPQIRNRVGSTALLRGIKALQQVSSSARGKVSALHALHRQQFPQQVSMLQGMAQGAGLPVDDLLLNSYFIELTDILASDPMTPIIMAKAAAAAGHATTAAAATSSTANTRSPSLSPSLSSSSSSSGATAGREPAPACPQNCRCSGFSRTPGGCSDVLLVLGPHQAGAGAQGRLLHGHNEDWSADAANGTFWLVHREASLTYVAPTSFGSLPGGGANSAGVSCSAQYVSPLSPLIPGAAREFVLAQLLTARSMQEVLALAAYKGQATGRSYNCLDVNQGLAANIETGPNGSISAVVLSAAAAAASPAAAAPAAAVPRVSNATAGPKAPAALLQHKSQAADSTLKLPTAASSSRSFYYHSNMYKHLTVPQHVEDSSLAREARVLQLSAAPPTTAEGVLRILGDTANTAHPIFRTAPGDKGTDCDPLSPPLVTLYTTLVDGNSRTLSYYEGNPAAPDSGQAGGAKQPRPRFVVDLKTFKATAT